MLNYANYIVLLYAPEPTKHSFFGRFPANSSSSEFVLITYNEVVHGRRGGGEAERTAHNHVWGLGFRRKALPNILTPIPGSASVVKLHLVYPDAKEETQRISSGKASR